MRNRKKGYREIMSDIARAFIFGLFVLVNFYAFYYLVTHAVLFTVAASSFTITFVAFTNIWVLALYVWLFLIDCTIFIKALPPCDVI
jgi:hypothetical protein